MRALQFKRSDHTLTFRTDFPEPTLRDPQDVIVDVVAAGVCGTDLHLLQGGLDRILASEVVPGHEVIAVVREMGSEVKDLEIGQLVALQPMGRCYECRSCILGILNLCEMSLTEHLGYGLDGGWADRCCLAVDHVYPVSNSLKACPELAVLIEPMGCILSGLAKLGPYLRAGSSILILGGGLVGTLWAVTLIFRGFRDILVIEPSPERRANLAKIPGVSSLAPEQLLPQHAAQIDVVIEACGSVQAVESGLSTLRDGGTLLLFGVFDKESFARISPSEIVLRELTLLSVLGNHHTFAEAADAVSSMCADGSLSVERIGLKVFPLEDFDTALTELKKRNITKAILKP